MESPSGSRATLRYIKWEERFLTEKPYQILSYYPHIPEDQRTNVSFEQGPEEYVQNVRGFEHSFVLDEHGFQFASDLPFATDFSSDEEIRKTCFPAVENLLRLHVKDVGQVWIFDYRVRKKLPSLAGQPQLFNLQDATMPLPPANNVHVDQSLESARKRTKAHFGIEAEKLLSGRVRIINVWSPLYHPVEDYPIAVCDGRTVKKSNLISSDHITRSYVGELLFPRYDSDAKWYYLERHEPSEVLFIKICDSDDSVGTQYCPHTSFHLEHAPENARGRESIEFRALVFSERGTL